MDEENNVVEKVVEETAKQIPIHGDTDSIVEETTTKEIDYKSLYEETKKESETLKIRLEETKKLNSDLLNSQTPKQPSKEKEEKLEYIFKR